jgi:hypothetical protein
MLISRIHHNFLCYLCLNEVASIEFHYLLFLSDIPRSHRRIYPPQGPAAKKKAS